MNRLNASIALALITGFTLCAQIKPDYLCTITKVEDPFNAEADAVLAATRKAKIGTTFSVHRPTGVMTGALTNFYANKPVVVDVGSKDNSYKVITTMRLSEGVGFGTSAYLLVIKEWAEGPSKPFVFFDSEYIYSGHAVHVKTTAR